MLHESTRPITDCRRVTGAARWWPTQSWLITPIHTECVDVRCHTWRRHRAVAACGKGAVCLMSSQFEAGVGGWATPLYSFTALQVCLCCDLLCDLPINRQKRNKNMHSSYCYTFWSLRCKQCHFVSHIVMRLWFNYARWNVHVSSASTQLCQQLELISDRCEQFRTTIDWQEDQHAHCLRSSQLIAWACQ